MNEELIINELKMAIQLLDKGMVRCGDKHRAPRVCIYNCIEWLEKEKLSERDEDGTE